MTTFYRTLAKAAVAATTVFLLSASSAHAQNQVQPGEKSDYNMAFESKCQSPMSQPGDKCDRYFRNFNGYCTNLRFQTEGMVDSAQRTYDKYYRTPTNLQSPRLISNFLVGDDNERPRPNGKFLTALIVFFGQFLDHNIVLTGVNRQDIASSPIPVPIDDGLRKSFVTGRMNFMKSSRSCTDLARPINCLTSAIDLAGVYGSKNMRANRLRKGKRGLLKFQRGGPSRQQFPPRYKYEKDVMKMVIPHEGKDEETNYQITKKFFMVGDERGNENRILASIHTIWLRNHNRLAKLVRKSIPKRSILNAFNNDFDEGVYQLAKRLNEATFQSIVFYEYYTVMTGRPLPSINYDSNYRPSLSDVFSTVGFRVGHTMVNKDIIKVGQSLREEGPRESITKLFFEESKRLLQDGVEPGLRGAMWQRAQEIDLHIVEELRNILFKDVDGERMNRDLVALNLQRSRDHNIPSFNRLRELLGLRKFRTFAEISKNRDVQDALETAYGNVDSIEAFPGVLAEDHATNSPMGETLAKIWEEDFLHLFKGDRFNFQENAYHPLLTDHMSAEVEAIKSGKRLFKQIILDNTNIMDDELPKSLFANKDTIA